MIEAPFYFVPFVSLCFFIFEGTSRFLRISLKHRDI